MCADTERKEQGQHSAILSPSQTIATFQPNIGCNMLRALGHRVVTCRDMMGVVGSNLKMQSNLWMLHDVVVWPGLCNNVAPGHAHYKFQLATWVAKRMQHDAPNKATICCVQML